MICFLLHVLLMTFSAVSTFAGQSEEVPEAPFQLEVRAEYEGAESIAALEWKDMSDNELGFEVLRSDDSDDFRVVGMVGANTARYQDRIGKYVTGVFLYKVRAFNEVGKSDDSNTASVWF